jgi:hypothetical protein
MPATKPEGRTKRELLKSISSIFDGPNRILGEVLVKYLMQGIWISKFD